ncbi:MAG TPA: DNA methyltransferase, partial [Armatimonadota bacterium]|nr:DNA methyltransferase [Armatimonadota bacterium]
APGENGEPIRPDITNDEWIEWARPVWYGIRETDTLNAAEARSSQDERHICPLQLGAIERCVRLWSNPGDTVLSPFAGIGSEGVVSLRHGRRFVGVELKPEYFRTAARNLGRAEFEAGQPTLMELMEAEEVPA